MKVILFWLLKLIKLSFNVLKDVLNGILCKTPFFKFSKVLVVNNKESTDET